MNFTVKDKLLILNKEFIFLHQIAANAMILAS